MPVVVENPATPETRTLAPEVAAAVLERAFHEAGHLHRWRLEHDGGLPAAGHGDLQQARTQ